jgi:hypothetical protein
MVLPRPVRDALQISPSYSLELETSEDSVILRPSRGRGRMYKKHGAWVFNSGIPVPPNLFECERAILGKRR